MNWRIKIIKALVKSLREEDDFKLRLGHSLVLQNPEQELYIEIVYGDNEDQVFDITFTPQTWEKVRAGMREVGWRLEKEYGAVEEGT